MSETKKRKLHQPRCKAGFGLAGVRSGKTISQIAKEFHVQPMQLGLWQKAIQERVKTLFEPERGAQAIQTKPGPMFLGERLARVRACDANEQLACGDVPMAAGRAMT